MAFPYSFIIRDIGTDKEEYETAIRVSETGEILKTISGIYRGKEVLDGGVYLLKFASNPDEAGRVEEVKVIIYGNKTMIFSEHMRYVVSRYKRRIYIVEQARASEIAY